MTCLYGGDILFCVSVNAAAAFSRGDERTQARRGKPDVLRREQLRENDVMGELKFWIAMAVSKLAAFVLRLFGRNASHLPGRIALKVCKDFIGRLQKPQTLICVTGTNGKTTTSNFIADALTAAGKHVTNNAFGSNVAAGVATALLTHSTFGGKHKNEYAVIEVDERSSLRVYPYMTPDYIICNNIMRDSVKRNAHTEFISYILTSAIPAETRLVLNADDPLCACIAPQCGERYYFGVTADVPDQPADAMASDAHYCPKCGAPLEADYRRFQHIGRYRCTACGFASPAPDAAVTRIDRVRGVFTVRQGERQTDYPLTSDNIVNIYNLCGCIALLTRLGLTETDISRALESAAVVRTRFEEVSAGDLHVTMILAKGQNPVAVSGVFRYVASRPEPEKCVLLIIDDKADNINNSENCSWFYDLDYAPLGDPGIARLIFAGKRQKDHILRAAMTGIDPDKIETVESVRDCSRLVDTGRYKNIFILYDNYFLDEARREEALLLERGRHAG